MIKLRHVASICALAFASFARTFVETFEAMVQVCRTFQPTVEAACKVVFATGQMLAHTAYRFVSKVGSGSAGACYGFVSLLRSLDRTTLKTI